MCHPDEYTAYVVGATFETADVAGTIRPDAAGESAALEWFSVTGLPSEINPYNRLLLPGWP